MNMYRTFSPIKSFIFVIVIAAAFIAAPVDAFAAAGTGPLAQPTPPPRIERPERIWRACTTNDKLEVTSVTVTPPGAGVGIVATVTMKIKNVCPVMTANLNVPWDIRKGTTTFATGTVTIGAGETKEVSGQWTLVWPPDPINFTGNADPAGTIPETVRKNNTKSVQVIPSIALNNYLIDHVNAKNAGANFNVTPDGVTPCRLESNGGSGGSPAGSQQVQLKINCLNWPAGGKVDVEGFAGFTLKNHWQVRSYEIIRGSGDFAEGGGKGWSLVSPPPGGTNPYFKIHLWADGFHGIELFVKIMIEGPSGTDPYR